MDFIDKTNDLFPHIFSEVTTSPTLWAGTNSGQVLAFVLTFSKNEEKRKEDKVEVIFVQYFCKNSFNSSLIKFSKHLKNYVHTTYFQLQVTLGKEVQLKHRAPVLAIQILDGSCIPVTSMSQSGMYKYISICSRTTDSQ